ncbi:MAG: hypothetical protein KBS62_07380 [Oscillospiraceae bacterium]|nr:hypothetical protein [Candidatus Ruminococcus equi]
MGKQSSPASKKNQDKNKKKNNKFGIILVSFLAGLILVVNVITASFSWFEPTSVNGNSIKLNETTPLRVEECEISQNFTGVQQTDKSIVYTEASASSTHSVPAGEKAYFKTVIINNSTTADTNISLFINQFPGATGGVSIAVTYPSNSYRTYTTAQTDLGIIRNATITARQKGNASTGVLEVEWFVNNKSSSAVTIDFSKLYILYN